MFPVTLADAKDGPSDPSPRPGSRDLPLTVSQVIRGVNNVLDQRAGTIWVEGEVASLSRASSGHTYFALKDRRSQIRVVMWRSDAARLKFAIEDGQHIHVRGRLGVYERDGKFQMYAQTAMPAGVGADAVALEQLRRKLADEGLFAEDRKRPLPAVPRRIGVVSSARGAAIRDVIRAVYRRFPVPILVADAKVQGTSAPRQIAHAIAQIGRTDIDVLIVGRGGGSATDLSAFNDELVVRAVAASPVPTISAVGHEVDVTLTDLVADRRAATPSMAGEMAVPVLADLSALLEKEQRRLSREIELCLRGARQDVDRLVSIGHSRLELAIHRGRRALADCRTRLEARHPRAQLVARGADLADLEARAHRCARRAVVEGRAELADLRSRAHSRGRSALDRRAKEFGQLAGRLDALSPLSVLERGYALAVAGDAVLTDAQTVSVGDDITVKLARGSLDCRVEAVSDGEPQDD